MAKFYKMGKPTASETTSAAQQPKSVRFNLEGLLEDEKKDEEQREPIVTFVQERFPGFFELPERCVPFEMPANDGLEGVQSRGFPAVLDLTAAACSSNSMQLEEEKTAENGHKESNSSTVGKRKSLFAQNFGKALPKIEKSSSREKAGDAGISETIKNLELVGLKFDNDKSYGEHSRLAMDPVQMDLASKCLRNVVPRLEQQIVRLFDALKATPIGSQTGSSESALVEQARQNLDAIRELFLEQIESEESGRRTWRFTKGLVEPLADPAWMLIPIRRVLDAVQQRSTTLATSDDVDIVRLSLLWTVLLLTERPTLFRGFVNPSGFLCRLAETFLIGPEVFLEDETVRNCLSLIIDKFLLPEGRKGLLSFRLSEPIAGLDAFMPFYGDLLQRFEEFSGGDHNFTKILLIGAYMNNSRLDALLTAQALWSLRRHVVRQMIMAREEPMIQCLLEYLAEKQCEESMQEDENQNEISQEQAKLAILYEAALHNGTVNEERNPALHAIANSELAQLKKRLKAVGSENISSGCEELMSERIPSR